MPIAQQGFNVSNTAQINPGVIVDSDINAAAAIAMSKLALAITNAEIDSAAAIAMSKLALAITNAEIAAGAAIADTKLAQITTAGKVSGAALTSLGSIPGGAGTIPAANLPAGTPDFALATASDTVIASADTARLTGQVAAYTKMKEMRVLGDGTYRIKFSLRREGASANTVFGRIYKNGVAVGTERSTTSNVAVAYSEDLDFTIGDLVQLYAHNQNFAAATTDCEVSLFKVCGVETATNATAVITD